MTQSAMSSVKLRHGAGVGAQLVGVAAALGFSYYFWRGGISGLPAVIWFSFAALVMLFCLTFGNTQFRTSPPRVFRQWRFLGFIPILRRDYSLDRFTGVQCCHQRGPQPEDSTWLVGLVERCGKFLVVQWFYTGTDGPCPEANEYALHLAELTRLPLFEIRAV